MNANFQKPFKQSQRTLFQAWNKKESCISQQSSTSNGSKYNPRNVDMISAAQAAEMASEIVDLTDDDLTVIKAAELMELSMSNSPGPSNVSDIKVEDLPGFDTSLGDIWIYPTNYPLREYQFNIVQSALMKNTLVSLPTGLGKTFIAAIVMYNFYRWYPQGKIIFMAPTKPLVTQQMEACYNIVGIPLEDQVEITGRTPAHKREVLWSSKRVFFLTPQVINNDLARGICQCAQIKCIVVDEAHKALGNYAYCQVINQLVSCTRQFRVLALSATPGIDVKSVQQVITNLLVSHIEIRSEDSIDIQGFSHHRKVEKVVCKLGKTMITMKNNYLEVIESFTKSLVIKRVLFQMDTSSYSKYGILLSRDQFRKDPPRGLSKYEMGSIEREFAICISLLHALELLLQHGMRSFFIFLKSMMEGEKGSTRCKSVLGANRKFRDIFSDLADMFGDSPNPTVLLTQAGQTQKSLQRQQGSTHHLDYIYSHPKIERLEEVVVDHFQSFIRSHENDTTRVMVFCQYRGSVGEITELLQKHRPLVRPMQFVGHSTASGKTSAKFTQKDQLEVVSRFRAGGYNTLISTCVGEEGLDIGDVDLIVCFDAHKSPIRLVQRMGRTGRKRAGRIVMLVTEGKEEKDYNASLSNRKSIHKAISGNSGRGFQLYQHNPRMIPRGLNPKPLKIHIMVKRQAETSALTKDSKKKQKKSGNENISVMMRKAERENPVFLNSDQLRQWDQKLKLSAREKEKLKTLPLVPQMLCLKEKTKASPGKRPTLSLSEWAVWQTRLQESKVSGHSSATKNLVEVMEICDVLRQCDDKEFDKNFAPFFGGKYDKSEVELKGSSSRKVLTKEKRLSKIIGKAIIETEKAEELQLSYDPDFVTERRKKLFPEKQNFKNTLANYVSDGKAGTPARDDDDTLAGIELIPKDLEMTADFLQDNSAVKHSDEAVGECLPNFDMGDWDVDDSPGNKSEDEVSSDLNADLEGAETGGVCGALGARNPLLHFVDNLSVISTQSANRNVATSCKRKASKEMSNPATPASLDAISFDFLDDLESNHSDSDVGCEEPTRRRACFSLGNSNKEIENSREQKQPMELDRANAVPQKRSSFDIHDKGKEGLSKEFKKTNENLGCGLHNSPGKFKTAKNDTVNEMEQSVSAKQPKAPQFGHSLVDMSADMFASQFHVDFDFGEFEDDESVDNDVSDSPVLASKPKSKNNSAADSGDLDEIEESLAPVTLSQRAENHAILCARPRKQNVPVAEIKPQQSLSFHRSTVGVISLSGGTEQRARAGSVKRKLSQESSDAVQLSCKKEQTCRGFASPVLSSILRNNSQDASSDESPLLGRKERPRSKKLLFSPVCGDSQQQMSEEEMDYSPSVPVSENVNLKKHQHLVQSPSLLLTRKPIEKVTGRKHSTPKCNIKYPKFNDFPEDEDFALGNRKRKMFSTKRKGAPSRDQVRNFLDDEAEVSNDGAQISTDEDEADDLEAWKEMKDFVNDATMLTQHVGNGCEIDERAMYLQRKPDFYSEPAQFEGHGGKFKLACGVGSGLDVFSQEVSTDVSGYEEDSFVCDEVEHETNVTPPVEVTMLEDVLEAGGKKQRVTRKQAELNRRKTEYDASPVVSKSTKPREKAQTFRKRIVCFDDSTDSIDSRNNTPKRSQGDQKIESDPKTWACPSCTLLNPLACLACELCDTEKPNSDAAVAEAGFRPWSCASCTYMNKNPRNACGMCGALTLEKSPATRGAENSKRTDLKASTSATNTVEQDRGLKNVNVVPSRTHHDVILATPVAARSGRDARKKLDVTASNPNVPGNKELASRIPVTPSCSKNSSGSSASPTSKEEREERLLRCRQKQMEFRARMQKRRLQQSGASSDKAGTSTAVRPASGATAEKAIRRVESPVHTSSDIISSSLANSITQASGKEENNVILIDSRQLSSSQAIITALRCKHAVRAVVASLPHCDYIVGRGTAVERKLVSDLSQVSNRQKMVATFQQLNIHYERVYLIIEQDRVKKGDKTSSGRCTRSSHYVSTVCAISNTNVRVLYSDGQDETADLLHMLASREKGLKRAIDIEAAEKANGAKYKTLLRLYSCVPKVSFVSALYMCLNFRNFKEAACCSVEKLIQKAHLSTCAAAEVYSFFRRAFDLQMTPSR